MQIHKHSITFDEITYDPKELYDTFSSMFHVRTTLYTSKTGGKCEIVDFTKHMGYPLSQHPISQRIAKHFPILQEQIEKNKESVRIFYHEYDAGIPPHVDENCGSALLFPICPWPIDPVIYLKKGDKKMNGGDWLERSEFRLDEIDFIHQYSFGHPSLINSKLPHMIHNLHDTIPRAILRFKIKIKSYEECLEMCKNGTFVIKDPV